MCVGITVETSVVGVHRIRDVTTVLDRVTTGHLRVTHKVNCLSVFII